MLAMKELLLCLVVFIVPCAMQECTLGGPLDATSRLEQTGHFLDLDQPATCSGSLVAWNFCYYANTVATGSVLTITFRIWRPQDGNRYTRISGLVVSVLPRSVQFPDVTVCNTFNLDPEDQILILEGDVYAVNMESMANLPVLAALPPGSGRRLFRDTSSRGLRRNELELLNDVGVHLFADIRTPPPSEPSATTLSIETDSTELPSPVTTTSGGMEGGGGGKTAAIVIVVLLLVLGAVVVVGILFVLHVKRRRRSGKASIFDCTKKNSTMVAMDNALYRLGSRHIAPLFSKSPSHRKRTDTYEYPDDNIVAPSSPMPNNNVILTSNGSSNPYDIPRDVLNSNTYSIPISISAVGNVNRAIVTQVCLESPVSPPHTSKRSAYKHPQERSCDDGERSSGVDGALDLRVESGDYIYMSGVPGSEEDGREKEAEEEEYIGPEDYQAKLVYDSVQYRALLQKATTDEGEEESPYRVPPSREDEIYIFISQQKIKVISRHTIGVTEVIGSGHFGQVDKGLWKSVKKNATLDVALKTLSNIRKTKDKIKLLQEAIIMGQFSHPNIVQLYGIVSYGEPLILVMEYMEKRDLKKYLLQLKQQQGRVIDDSIPGLLLDFSEQVALGLHYLASKRLVHRDLAARNVLVSKDNICKIGDFGMARDISDNGFYSGNDGKVPLKWTAPEAISLKKYSIASDVWSYGCLLYEIWSLGVKPYKGLKNEEAILKINSGYRLPPPPGCPQAIYTLMMQCWHPFSSARPKYQVILTALLEDPKKVLLIPQLDVSSHSLACLLGSPLATGLKMYPDLQITYVPKATDQRDPHYEHVNNDTDSDT